MEEKKNKKKIVSLILLVLGVVLVGVGLYFYFGKKEDTKEVASRPNLKDDFYNYVNYETINNARIPSDNSAWSHGYDVIKTVEKRKKELTNEILQDPNYKNEDIDHLLELFNDYEGRNKRGFDELKPYIDLIDNAKTIEDINNIVLKLDEEISNAVFIVGEATQDLNDSTKNVFAFSQVDNFELFTDAKYARILEIAKKLFNKATSILGYDETKQKETYDKYLEFAKKMSEKSIKQDEISGIEDVWHKYTLDQITNEIKNIPIKRYLDNRGIGNEEYYIVVDMGQLKALDEFYTIDNLPLIKEILKVNLVSTFLEFTTEENQKFVYDLYNEQNGTKMTIEEMREKTELALKTAFIDDEIQKRYEAKYFTDEDKKIVADLVEEVKNNYKDLINNSDWLSEETRTRALTKLDKMKVNIGYQESNNNDKDYYVPLPKANGGTLIKYIIESNKYDFKKENEEFHKEAETEKMSTLAVNAYYSPMDNSINFLAGFKGMYENETDYYKKLAYFGTVIAHEISHAFDNNGSKYDENGKFNDWWTAEDRANYENLKKKIEDYYSKYEVQGFKVNGHKTVGENIADLAGVKSIITIMEKKGATKEDFKKFFEGYADLWAEKSTKEGIENQIISDEHAPDIIRVNGVLSSMDKFYEVYDIKEGDKMYVPKEERVGLW